MPSFACMRNSGTPWCSVLAKFGACRAVRPRPPSVLGATSSSPGADASVHLLHGDLGEVVTQKWSCL